MKKRYFLLPLACALAAIGSARAQLPCTNPITAFPYNENFDTGPGGWTAATSTANWTLGTVAKPTINAPFSGPNAWIVGGLTGTYADNASGSVVSPCFNFSALTLPVVEVKVWWECESTYDGVALQSSIDGGANWVTVGVNGDPDNWYQNTISSMTGGQQDGWSGRIDNSNNGSNMWVSAKHNLPSLAGQANVRLRFLFTTDGSVVDDGFAFDNFQIYEPAPNDVGVAAITAPLAGTFCSLNAQDVTVRLQNFGSAPQSNVPVTYSVNATVTGTATFTGTIAPGATALFTFPTQFTPSGNGVYTFTATTSLAGDANPTNNAAPSSVIYTVVTPITAFPYTENFDAGPGGWTSGGASSSWTLGNPAKPVIQGTASGANAWVTGRTADYNANEQSFVLSPCFDFTGQTLPVVEFQAWWDAASNQDGTVLQSSINGGATWQTIGAVGDPDNWYNSSNISAQPGGQSQGWTGDGVNGSPPLPGSGGYVLVRHEMPQLANQASVRLRVAFASTAFSARGDGFAFDNFRLYQPAPNDVGLTALVSPVTNTSCALGAQTVTVRIRNYGTATQTSIPMTYSVNGTVVGTATFTGSLAPGATTLFTFPTPFVPAAAGVYTFTATTTLAGDTNPGNNDAPGSTVFTIITPITAFPYNENFDAGPGGWVSGGANSSWTLGNPAKPVIQGTASGANAWVTGRTASYNNNEQSFVLSPCFDFAGQTLPVVEFQAWWNSDSNDDGAVLQSSINGGTTWQTIGAVGDPDNWYNSSNISAQPGGQSQGWTGDGVNGSPPLPGSGGYVLVRHEMPQLANQASVRLRVAFASTAFSARGDGFAFDNFRLYQPAPNDVGLAALVSPVTNTSCALGAQTVTVRIRNYGTATQTSIPVTYSVNGPIAGAATFTGSLAPGTTTLFTFPAQFTPTTPGAYTFTASTNLSGDANPGNNDAPGSAVFTIITPISTFPYAESFENGPGGWVSGGANSSWVLGTPSKGAIQGAANGIKAWVTGLTAPYNNNEQSYVLSPCFDFTNNPLPGIELQVAWEAASNDDGAALQSSTDGGVTWQIVGAINDPDNWYNGTVASAPGGQSAGWTGNGNGFPTPVPGSGGYVLARHNLTGLGGRPSVRLRIAFASNGFTNDDGFAFDDVKILALTPPPPPPANDLSVINIPQPTSGCALTANETIAVVVANRGTVAQTNVPITVTYTEPGGTVRTLTRTLAAILPGSGNVQVVVFTQQQNFTARGCYNMRAYATLATDQVRANDTATAEVCNQIIAVTPTTPYFQNFEGRGSGWSSVGGSWALGTPAKSTIQGAASGARAWVTAGLGTNRYGAAETSSVQSICYDLSTLTDPIVELKIWYETEGQRDGASLQCSINNGATWSTIGGLNDPTNWYTAATLPSLPGGFPAGWSGSSGGYVLARHTLVGTIAQGQSSVRFRMAFAAVQATPPTSDDVNDGVAFDDFALYQRPTTDVAVVGVQPLGSACGFSASETITVRVRNLGSSTITSLPVSYQLGTGAVVNVSANVALLPNLETLVAFPPINLSGVTACQNLTVTASANGDQLSFNNSLTIRICPPPVNGVPTVIDFEGTGDLSRFSMRTLARSRVALAPARGTNGSTAMLLTGGGGNWIDPIGPGNSPWTLNPAHLAIATICVRPGSLPAGTPLRLAFNLRQVSSGVGALFSNVNFRMLVNGTVVGPANVQPSPTSPGSGSFRWLSYDISSLRVGTGNILVELQSSVNRNFTNGRGDANFIDNFVVDAGLAAPAESAFAQGVAVFPNPSTGVFQVSLNHAGARTYALAVIDLMGRTVRRQDVRSAGHAETAVDLTTLARGTYLLQVTDSEGNRVMRKLTLE